MTALSEALMWRGITPPPAGSNRTTCPHCSHTRRKSTDRCLSIFAKGDRLEWVCRHCGWEDEEQI